MVERAEKFIASIVEDEISPRVAGEMDRYRCRCGGDEIIAGVLVWNVITAPHPLAQLMPGMARTAQHPPTPTR